jgi:hypothetical protein
MSITYGDGSIKGAAPSQPQAVEEMVPDGVEAGLALASAVGPVPLPPEADPGDDDIPAWDRPGLMDLGGVFTSGCEQAALRYCRLGWSVLPICPPDHLGVGDVHREHCEHPGKAPCGEWKERQDRPLSEGEIKDRWACNCCFNVGIALGPVSGLIGIDVDGTGADVLLEEISGGDLPPTLEFTTPGGGRRLLYRIPSGVTLRTTYAKPGPKQEVRFMAKGSQTVMPPSLHASGGCYRWKPGHGPDDREAAVAPPWLVERLRADGVRPLPQPGLSRAPGGVEKIYEGSRDGTLTSIAGSMRRRGMGEEAIAAGLLVDNEDRCVPPLSEAQVWKIARSVAKYPPEDSIPAPIEREAAGNEFPLPIPASQLVASDGEDNWIWEGFLAPRGFTLLSALWKSGKTTLLSLLLQMTGSGSTFCGQRVRRAKVLVVSEEPQSLWVERRDLLGLGDNVEFYTRDTAPFLGKPTHHAWESFIKHLAGIVVERGIEVVIFDTIFHFWPAQDENDSAEVLKSITPLQRLTGAGAGVLLVAHVKKSDGGQGTATRGSGALPGIVDVILEFRRFDSSWNQDRRRVITTYSRYNSTPEELVVELSEDGLSYKLLGDRQDATKQARRATVSGLLPTEPPGITSGEILEAWTEGLKPSPRTLQTDLKEMVEAGEVIRTGEGVKGRPFRFWKGQPTDP